MWGENEGQPKFRQRNQGVNQGSPMSFDKADFMPPFGIPKGPKEGFFRRNPEKRGSRVHSPPASGHGRLYLLSTCPVNIGEGRPLAVRFCLVPSRLRRKMDSGELLPAYFCLGMIDKD